MIFATLINDRLDGLCVTCFTLDTQHIAAGHVCMRAQACMWQVVIWIVYMIVCKTKQFRATKTVNKHSTREWWRWKSKLAVWPKQPYEFDAQNGFL